MQGLQHHFLWRDQRKEGWRWLLTFVVSGADCRLHRSRFAISPEKPGHSRFRGHDPARIMTQLGPRVQQAYRQHQVLPADSPVQQLQQASYPMLSWGVSTQVQTQDCACSLSAGWMEQEEGILNCPPVPPGSKVACFGTLHTRRYSKSSGPPSAKRTALPTHLQWSSLFPFWFQAERTSWGFFGSCLPDFAA